MLVLDKNVVTENVQDVHVPIRAANDESNEKGYQMVACSSEETDGNQSSSQSENPSNKSSELEDNTKILDGINCKDETEVLIALGSQNSTFIYDEDGTTYIKSAKSVDGQTVYPVYIIGSPDFKDFLVERYFRLISKAPKKNKLAEALETLSAIAKHNGTLQQTHVRVAVHEGAYIIDLCNDKYQVIKVTADYWEILDDSPVLFIRSRGMRALPTPVKDTGNLEKLWDYVNIQEQDRLIVCALILEYLRSDTPYPVFALYGEHGSAKSSTQKIIRSLIDPNKADLRAAPKSIDDLFVNAKNCHLASFENISEFPAGIQDAMCILATGGGYAKRTLYTDSDETVMNLKKPLMINSIPIVVTAQDLLDRSVVVGCKELTQQMDELTLKEMWVLDRAVVFTGILDMFVATLAQMPNVDLKGERLPRMVDFTRLGEALSLSFGNPPKAFLNEYRERRKASINNTLDSHPVAVAMIKYLSANPEGYVGTVGGLFTVLDAYKETSEDWVKSPRAMGVAIQRLQPGLRQIGIALVKGDKRTSAGFTCSLMYISV